jgi:hypothetical protein
LEILGMKNSHDFEQNDFSMAVKSRDPLPNAWRWEIYRAGRRSPIKQSPGFFASMAIASIAEKAAFKRLMDELYA